MVPMYIYLESSENWLNTVRFALCLAMGSDRIIAKQGNCLLGYDTNSLCLTFLPELVYFILRDFW